MDLKCLFFSLKSITHGLINYSSYLIVLVLFSINTFPVLSQLSGGEKTMEQFLDSLLHSSVYDRRIRPFASYESKY
jgi:hypothetical protein